MPSAAIVVNMSPATGPTPGSAHATHQLLVGTWAKVERAKTHRLALADEILAFNQANPGRLEGTYNSSSGLHVIRIVSVPDYPVVRWGVVVGDVVHNLRSALDHLAWQMANPSCTARHPVACALPDRRDEDKLPQGLQKVTDPSAVPGLRQWIPALQPRPGPRPLERPLHPSPCPPPRPLERRQAQGHHSVAAPRHGAHLPHSEGDVRATHVLGRRQSAGRSWDTGRRDQARAQQSDSCCRWRGDSHPRACGTTRSLEHPGPVDGVRREHSTPGLANPSVEAQSFVEELAARFELAEDSNDRPPCVVVECQVVDEVGQLTAGRPRACVAGCWSGCRARRSERGARSSAGSRARGGPIRRAATAAPRRFAARPGRSSSRAACRDPSRSRAAPPDVREGRRERACRAGRDVLHQDRARASRTSPSASG